MISEPINPKKRSSGRLTLILILALTFLGLLFLMLNSQLFKAKAVVLKNIPSCTDEQIIKKSINISGQRIFSVDNQEITKILKRYPCVKDVKVTKVLPDKVILEFSERAGVIKINTFANPFPKLDLTSIEATASTSSAQTDLIFSTASPSESFSIDEEGFLFAKDSQLNNTLVINYAGNALKLGDSLGRAFVDGILSITEGLKTEGIQITSVRVVEGDVLVSGETTYLFSLKKDLNRQLASLQLLFRQAKIDSKRMEKLDLRFDKPVVVYSPKKS